MPPIHPPPPAADDLDDAVFHAIAQYIYNHARIQITGNKRELVRARLGRIIRQRGFSGYRQYYAWMAADKTGEAAREVMNAIATNLTSFFRENAHFEFLAESIVPEYLHRVRRRLRGWSAGCSTGQEIYTIAMVLLERLGDAAGWDIKLLATDLDTEVIAQGARGFYVDDHAQGIPVNLRRKYFDDAVDERGKSGVQAKDILRSLVTFRHLNLFSRWPFKNPFDFVFCRNVMIYFDRPTQEQLIERYHQALAPGGYLFIGHSESLSGVKHAFEYVLPTIYRKKGAKSDG